MAERPPIDGPPEPEDPETGEPLSATLEALDEPAPAGLLDGVRRGIHRKALAAQIVELVWTGPAMIFQQWLAMLLGWLAPAKRDDEGAPDE